MSERPGISLEEWFPLVQDIVPVPRTLRARTTADLAALVEGEGGADDRRAYAQLVATLRGFAEHVGGYPLFLRTGHFSGKHDWSETCYVESDASMLRHVANIAEASELASWPDSFPLDVWVVRELLDTRLPETFRCRAYGGFPVSREQRWFVEDGRVAGHQAYWPEHAIEEGDPDVADWHRRLGVLNACTDESHQTLTVMTAMVGAAVPGAWSVDWLWARRGTSAWGWWLTDMAWAERSYVDPDHPCIREAAKWSR